MKHWESFVTNDPYDDYNLVIEILFDNKFVAVIKQSPQGLTLKWYAYKEDLVIPVDWLSDLLIRAKKDLVNTTE